MQTVVVAVDCQLRIGGLNEFHYHSSEAISLQRGGGNLRLVLGEGVVWSQDHIDFETLTITELRGTINNGVQNLCHMVLNSVAFSCTLCLHNFCRRILIF